VGGLLECFLRRTFGGNGENFWGDLLRRTFGEDFGEIF